MFPLKPYHLRGFAIKILLLQPKIFDMQTTELVQPDVPQISQEEEFDQNFKPKGAIAFFVLLVLLGAFIWYGIYFIMLGRV
jgi:hypothetical protein